MVITVDGATLDDAGARERVWNMKETRLVSLDNHTHNAFHVMRELREREELCDITLCVDGVRFNAHKIVLAGCSPYLRAMFTNGMLETEKSLVSIRGIESPTMRLILDFIYCGVVEITTGNVQALLQGASLLNMSGLRNVCCQFLQAQIEASNCLGIQSFADVYSCVELETAARHYVERHFADVVRSDEFFQLPESRLVELLKSESIQVEREEQIFEAAMSWIDWDPLRRAPNVCRVLPHVKLAHLDRDYLEERVVRADFVRACSKCQNVIAMAMRVKTDNNALATIRPRAQPQCIFVVGGRTSVASQLSSMERYDVVRDQWIPMGSMKHPRTAVGAATLRGLMYTIGGERAVPGENEDTLYLHNVECYDPILKDWTNKCDMKMPRSFIATVAFGGYLYAIGGENRNCSFDLVERYCPQTDSWCYVSSMKKKRAGAGAAVCEGRLYVAGGYDKTFHTDRASVECYDPEHQEWTFTAEMSKARSGLVLVAIEYFIFAIGGRFRHTDRYSDLVERYNTLTEKWDTMAAMNTPRAWPAAAVFDGKVYIMGGFDGFNRLRTAEVYDPTRDTWTYVSNMNISRAGSGSAVV
ncbi:kelch-like protein 12 [Tubulanus polymorphus]|uniref:kelch-like protein 12 n=1 Tax=Tubulanus polymorphus TaxID=672921 RepID=UPI003DA650FB